MTRAQVLEESVGDAADLHRTADAGDQARDSQALDRSIEFYEAALQELELAGDEVDHKVFDRITVRFRSGGTKKLLLGFAPIRKVSD